MRKDVRKFFRVVHALVTQRSFPGSSSRLFYLLNRYIRLVEDIYVLAATILLNTENSTRFTPKSVKNLIHLHLIARRSLRRHSCLAFCRTLFPLCGRSCLQLLLLFL